MSERLLTHALLDAWNVRHGFALRGVPMPADLLRPKQVHGVRVVDAEACREDPPPEADAVVSSEPGVAVGVVTADCVPVLLAAEGGRVVAAVHAGWRGLAAGVVAQGVDAVRQRSDAPLRAVLGPHIGLCCYEVDAPVLETMSERFASLDAALEPTRAGHARIDLGALVVRDLLRSGLAEADVARLPGTCTACDAERFHSYRRDGARAGRLWHFIAPAQA